MRRVFLFPFARDERRLDERCLDERCLVSRVEDKSTACDCDGNIYDVCASVRTSRAFHLDDDARTAEKPESRAAFAASCMCLSSRRRRISFRNSAPSRRSRRCETNTKSNTEAPHALISRPKTPAKTPARLKSSNDVSPKCIRRHRFRGTSSAILNACLMSCFLHSYRRLNGPPITIIGRTSVNSRTVSDTAFSAPAWNMDACLASKQKRCTTSHATS